MYKAIFIDFSMPDMNGPQVAQSCRELFKSSSTQNLKEPLLVCFTAYGEASFMREAFQAGMNKFITKPVSDEDLTDCLRALL